jgi:hypothetical protein
MSRRTNRLLHQLEWMIRKMEQRHDMQTATWFVSRELSEVAGPRNTWLLGDDVGKYFARILVAADSTRFVPGARVYYRISTSSCIRPLGDTSCAPTRSKRLRTAPAARSSSTSH